MGHSKQRAKPKQSRPSRAQNAKRSRPKPPQNTLDSVLDPRQLTGPEQLLVLQRQIGNRSTNRLISAGANGLIQRDFLSDKVAEYKAEKQAEEEAKQNETHEFDAATYEEKSALAKKLAKGLAKVMDADYEAMIADDKGLKAIDVTAKIDRYLEAAFKVSEKGFHDYIGKENLALVLEQINANPGLYDKLALLRAMEPHHARLIGAYLDIPPLKGFDYEMSTLSVGIAPEKAGPVGKSDTKVEIKCKQDGKELWTQSYLLSAIGVGAGLPIPGTVTAASGTFETLVFWGPRDFVGEVEMGSASAGGYGIGYSFGVGTFRGNGSKGSLTIDMSGKINTSGEVGVSAFFGYMVMVGSGTRSAMPEKFTLGYEPKIKVTEDVDKELSVTFPENSDEPGGSFKREFLKFLAHALEAERLHVTITAFTTPDKKYNAKLMQKRIKATRKMVDEMVEERGIDSGRVMIEEVETKRDEDPGQWKDPPRDRITKVQLKGTITLRSPGEAQ